MVKSRKSSARTKKILLIALAVILVAGAALFVLEKKQITNFYGEDPAEAQNDEDAQTTSTAETAQDDFTGGDDREPGSSVGEGEGEGSITDNNGAISSDVDTSSPIVSSTGQISIYTPKNNASISSGQVVAGVSTLQRVSFRLIDNVSGVISVGELNVVNGKFSGTLSFSTSADEGRLDIFGANPDGSEYSNLEIPLRFK